VKNRFQSLPFKCNLQRYTPVRIMVVLIFVAYGITCVVLEPQWGAAG
jgi:hypothetical protein